jgi:hypothetical protein
MEPKKVTIKALEKMIEDLKNGSDGLSAITFSKDTGSR